MKSLFWISSATFSSSSMDSSLVVIRLEQYITALLAGLEKRTGGFLPCLTFHSLWPSVQWNSDAPWPLLKEVHHLYFLLSRVIVSVVKSLVSDTTAFLLTHSGSSFVELLGVIPLEPFTVDLQSFLIWPFYHTCDRLYLTWQMTFFQSHYRFHCSGSWNQPDLKPCWSTVEWPQCMPSEAKVGLETFLCL